MRKTLLAAVLLVALSSVARADFSDGQQRFAAGDHAGAYAEWQPLAEAGDARAQYSLGVMHQKGLGRPKDAAGAAAWFERAAKQGYGPATAALKSMGKAAPGSWAKASTERDRVANAVRSMLSEPGGASFANAIRVSEAGDGFDVQIEAFDLPGKPGTRLRVPQLNARATPAAADAWRFDFKTPTLIEGESKPGERYRARIGEGRTILVWNETLELTTGVDVDWRGIVFETGDAAPLRLARMALRSALERQGADRWGGPSEVRFEGLEMAEPGKAEVKLAAAYVRMALGGADIGRFMRLAREGEGDNPLNSLSELRGLLSDASVEVGIEGLDASHPDGRFRLGDGSWRMALAKLDQPEFDLEIGYRHGGLADDRLEPTGGPAPQEAQLKLALVRAPMEALLQAGMAAGIEYMLLGQVSSAPAIAESLRKALPAAGTQLRIEDGLLRAARARLTVAGAFAADAGAALGVAGALGVSIVGLDELLAASPASAKARPLLAEYGQTAPDGSTVFRFELGRDGAALVNGKPLAPLLAALFAE